MCGIIGYIGTESAEPKLVTGLERMEYRGYDSAGVATIDNYKFQVTRVRGKVRDLREALAEPQNERIGIGHTRWATHGEPSVANAHPHVAGRIAVVHNGIVENYVALKQKLIKNGVSFQSSTDSEVLAALINTYYDGRSLRAAVQRALKQVEGAYGLVVMAADRPDELIVARRSSPLIIGRSGNGIYIASDASALAGYADEVVYLNDNELAQCRADGFTIFNHQGESRTYTAEKLDLSVTAIQKQGYEHFLLKEITEQPDVVQAVIRGRLDYTHGISHLGGLNLVSKHLAGIQHIFITGCGTAYYAGLLAKYMLEKMTGLPVSVETASEFRYRDAVLPTGSVALIVSQSGETADTLAAAELLKAKGVPTLGIVNVVGSTIARTVDGGVYLHAGPEISVASTKAFTSQVIAMLLFGLTVGRTNGHLSLAEGRRIVGALKRLPQEIAAALATEPVIQDKAAEWGQYEHAFYLGRDTLFPIALEGSHKLKEISYIQAEGYAAGEMKHGANALIDERLLTVFLLGKGSLYQKSLSNLSELQARGGHTVIVTNSEDYAAEHPDALPVKTTSEWTAPLVMNIVLQLMAYYVAAARDCEIDQPRNLAKSVTVE